MSLLVVDGSKRSRQIYSCFFDLEPSASRSEVATAALGSSTPDDIDPA